MDLHQLELMRSTSVTDSFNGNMHKVGKYHLLSGTIMFSDLEKVIQSCSWGFTCVVHLYMRWEKRFTGEFTHEQGSLSFGAYKNYFYSKRRVLP